MAFYSGIVDKMDNEAEMAFVMAHEIAHAISAAVYSAFDDILYFDLYSSYAETPSAFSELSVDSISCVRSVTGTVRQPTITIKQIT